MKADLFHGQRRPLGLAISGLLLASVVGLIWATSTSAQTVDDANVRLTIASAMKATQEVPSHQSMSQAKAQKLTSANWVASATSQFAQYYTGDALARKISIVKLDATEFDQPTTDREGVRNVVVNTVAVSGDTATATATCDAWAISQITAPGGSPTTYTATNTVNWSFHLTKISGKWLIDSEDWNFAPGSEP